MVAIKKVAQTKGYAESKYATLYNLEGASPFVLTQPS